MNARRQVASSGGYTLIELLVTIAVLGAIAGVLGAALTIGEKTVSATNNRLAGSHDAQNLATWLPADVQSTGNGQSDVAINSTTDCSNIPNALRLHWAVSEGAGTDDYVAAYAVVQVGSGWQLKRFYCKNGVQLATIVIARNLANANAVSTTVNGTRIAMTITDATNSTDNVPYTFTVEGTRRTS